MMRGMSEPPLLRLRELMGTEHELTVVSRLIRNGIQDMEPAAVGAHQINCSDESERECVEVFHRIVVRRLLPELKYASASSFRSVNLGSRYEMGSVAIAEDHYVTTQAAKPGAFKVLVVKLNTHVSVVREPGGLVFGHMDRYDRHSHYCGAIHALLNGAEGGFIDDLRQAIQEDTDRLAIIKGVSPNQQHLHAAIVSAQRQIWRAQRDVMANESRSPTVYLLLGAVTLNREDEDTELLVGLHTIDERSGRRVHDYVGLGDDPGQYRVQHEEAGLRVVAP